MTISFWEFIEQLAENPALRVTVLLILGTILVNGWTDAPNAIASVVASGGMKLKDAVRMAAVCNLAGMFIMTAFNAKVAFTIYHLVDFGGNPANSLAVLCAALTAIILWAASAWCFGIPTSESHALIAGISGAGIAMRQDLSGINGQEWLKVLYGLIFSIGCGFLFGWLGGKAISSKRWKCRDKFPKRMTQAQKVGAGAMAFMHGAQDGQKFIGVFLLGIFLAEGRNAAGNVTGGLQVPFWMLILCSVVMAAGTAIGGERIIKTIGNEMVNLKKAQGAAADAAGACCLLLASLMGIPVSTTHVKTTAIMGVGMAEDTKTVNKNLAKEIFFAWMITFPCCGGIGYLAARLFLGI